MTAEVRLAVRKTRSRSRRGQIGVGATPGSSSAAAALSATLGGAGTSALSLRRLPGCEPKVKR